MRRTLRTLPLLAALLAVALPAAPAAADGGSAACTVPFEIARTQSLGDISLTPGAYKVTVLDTSEMTCDEANDQLRAVLREPGNDLPEGWKLDAGTGTISRTDGTDAFRFDPDMSARSAAVSGPSRAPPAPRSGTTCRAGCSPGSRSSSWA